MSFKIKVRNLMFSFLIKTDESHLHKIYAKTDLPLASKYLSKLSVTCVVTHPVTQSFDFSSVDKCACECSVKPIPSLGITVTIFLRLHIEYIQTVGSAFTEVLYLSTNSM